MDHLYEKNIIETKFSRLRGMVGREVALYALCAVLDVPYAVKTDAETWDDYLSIIQEGGIDPEAGFGAGVTDVMSAAQAEMSESERWREIWGTGNQKSPYTEADYKRLDHLFRTYSARLAATGGFDEQQEFMLRSVCTDQLLAEKFRDNGTKEGIEIYTKIYKTIQDKLGSENLRKKDILPQQEQRLDGFVDALKKKYGVDASLSHEQAVGLCSQWLMSHHYPMTRDAADHILLSIVNCTRMNNDAPELTELPKGTGFGPECCEFADEPNDMELEAYGYLGLERRDGK